MLIIFFNEIDADQPDQYRQNAGCLKKSMFSFYLEIRSHYHPSNESAEVNLSTLMFPVGISLCIVLLYLSVPNAFSYSVTQVHIRTFVFY